MKKGIIIGAISFVVGGVVGYFVGKNVTIKVYDGIIDQTSEEIKAYYEEEHKKLLDSVNEKEAQQAEEVLKNWRKPELSEISVPYFEKSAEAAEKENLQETTEERLNREYIEDLEATAKEYGEDATEDVMAVKESIRQNAFEDKITIYTIDEETYYSSENEYNLEHLTYYRPDGILGFTDDDEVILHEIGINQTIGSLDILDISNANGNKPTYVRNDSQETDYEIEYEDRTYKEVTGHDPD